MIYLKLAIFREDNLSHTFSRHGTAEFMFRDFDPECATRLAVALLKARGWRCVDIVDAAAEDFASAYARSEQRRRLFQEAMADDVAYEITVARPLEQTEAVETAVA